MYESIRRRGEQNAATPRGVARRFGKQCPRLHVARCLSNAARRNAWCTQDGPDLNELEQLVRVDVVKHAVHHAQRTVLAHLRGCVYQQGDLAAHCPCTARLSRSRRLAALPAPLYRQWTESSAAAAMLLAHRTAYAATCSEQDLPAPLSRESPAWPCSPATQECRTGSPCPLHIRPQRRLPPGPQHTDVEQR